jgi:hypothetical protein
LHAGPGFSGSHLSRRAFCRMERLGDEAKKSKRTFARFGRWGAQSGK